MVVDPSRLSRRVGTVGLFVLAASLACSSSSTSQQPPSKQPAAAEPGKVAFENPGGMWMPSQMAEHATTLEELGLDYSPSALTDPTAFPLGAVVSLGGCSASFVSPDGLVITNHHCVIGALQYNSTPQANLLHDGFLAADRGDERWAGPTARVYVTTSFTDVTADVVGGLDAIEDPKARAEALDKRVDELEAACEKAKADTRCRVRSYFAGAQYFRIEQLELRDIRLVYAPHEGIGVFGGEVDNWRWPRHTGDFSFLRAYVAPDGKPADHAAENVPYHPPHHLEIATKGAKAGDLAMVAGYPGRTYRLRTADEVRDAVDWYYPHSIAKSQAEIALLEGIAKDHPDLAIKAASRLRRLHNRLTNYQGMLDGLSKGGLLERKQKLEKDLQTWIDADPERKKTYGTVLADIAKVAAERRELRDTDDAIEDIAESSRLLGVAGTILEMAKQRAKPEAERKPQMAARLHHAEESMTALSRRYDPVLDRAQLRLALRQAAALPDGQRPDAVLEAVVGKGKVDDAKIDAALAKLYAKTRLGDEKTRLRLLRTATPAQLARSRDPFIRLVQKLEPFADDISDRHKRYDGQMASLRPVYVAALRASGDGPLAPDANGTLRVTYGTIRGYRPSPDAEPYAPFTTLSQMVAKNTGEPPFDAPASILEAAKHASESGWVDPALGDVPVDFLADLDITGGNSGSATLDAHGALIGLAFDGNYESIASDWVFMPDVTRSIHVDIRYVMFVMDWVDHAHALMKEMGVTPHAPAAEPAAAKPAVAVPAGREGARPAAG